MRRTGLIPCLWFIVTPSARRRIPSRTSLMYSLVIVVIHRELEWLWMDPFRIVLWVQSWCVMSLQRRWWFWSPSECPKKLVAKRLYVSMVIEWYVERLQLWKQAGEIGRRLWRQWVIIIVFIVWLKQNTKVQITQMRSTRHRNHITNIRATYDLKPLVIAYLLA